MSEAVVKARGETAFGIAGDGVILRFRNSDLKAIEEARGPQWFNELIDKWLKGLIEMDFFNLLVERGAKKDGEPYTVPEAVLDELPVYQVADTLLDAVCTSMKGLTFKEYLDETFAAAKLAEEEGEDPPT